MFFVRLAYVLTVSAFLAACASSPFGRCPGPNETYLHGTYPVDSRALFEWLKKCNEENAHRS